MAWFYIKLPGGTLKVKPRSQLRSMELARQVPVLDLGFFVMSWWNDAMMRQDERHRQVLGKRGP